MKKEDCLTVDWYNIGYEDGTSGHKTSRIAQHRKSCSKYGVILDLQAYLRGHTEGLKEYCTPHQGYMLGLKGRRYNDVCQGEFEGPFQKGYNLGRDIHQFEKDIRKEQKDMEKLNEELFEIQDRLKMKEAQLSKDCAKKEKCKQILDDIRNLDKKKRVLRLNIRGKKNLIDTMKQTVTDMKAHNQF